jgi:signal transduction histidine kinase
MSFARHDPKVMPRIFRTISFRLAALYLLLFVASAVILGSVIYWTTGAALEQQLAARVALGISHLEAAYHHGGLPRLIYAVEERERTPGALDYLVQAPDGAHVAGEIAVVGARRGWLVTQMHNSPTGNEPRRVRAFAKELPGGIVIAAGDDVRRVRDPEEAVLGAFAWSIGATVVLGAAGGVWLSQLFLRRVDAISRTAEAIIAGDLSQRVPVRGTGDDLDYLAGTLNRMLDQIGALMESIRQASNNIAHDLRTPLSHLGHRLEDARARATTVAEYQQALDGAKQQIEALLTTFASLLRIAEVEAGAQRAAFAYVDLSAIADTVAEAFAPAAEEQGHKLKEAVTPGVVVYGDRELLTQMLANLVENALHHTPPGTGVCVSLSTGAAGVMLAVEDNGPGIPEAERERVLQRFYRLEYSRTTPGSGLGLSLVAAIAELHRASLRLEDAYPGLRVSVMFPHTQRT